jgi:hypothetical protein
MKFTQLKRHAIKAQSRADVVSLGLSGHSLLGWIRYVAYRIKLPVFFKITTRILLLLEIWLIYQYFNYNVFSNLTLYLFILVLTKNILRGIPQFYRTSLSKSVSNKNQDKFNILLSKGLIVSIFFSLSFAVLLSLLSLKLEFFDNNAQYFIASWCLLLPLELVTSLLWSSVYLKRRLPRSSITVLACRLFPIICLLYLSQYLGALSYILGVFIGRLSEKIYLISLSINALDFRFRLKKNDKSYYRIIKRFILNKIAIRYLIFHACLPAYFLGLAMILFVRNESYALNYIIYYFLLSFSVYICSQISRSIGYDIFQSIRNGQIRKAQLMIKRGLFFSTFLSLLAIIIFLLLVTQSNYIYLFLPEKIGDYLLLLLALQLIYTILYSQLQFVQSASLEHKNTFMKFILTSLLVQGLFIHYYNVNLQTAYFIEILIFSVLSIRLFFSLNLSISPFYFEFIKKERKQLPYVSPESFQLACRAKFQKEGRLYLYLLAYHERDCVHDKVLACLPKDNKLLITRYTANLFLVTTERNYLREDFSHFSLMSLVDLSIDKSVPFDLTNSIYRFMYSLDLRNSKFQKTKNYFKLSQSRKDELALEIDRNITPEQILPDLHRIPQIKSINNKIKLNLLRSTQTLKEFAFKNYFNTNRYVIPNIKGSLISVKTSPSQTLYFDLSAFNGHEITLIKRQLFFISQYCYFKNIIQKQAAFSCSIREYLLVKHILNKYCSRKKIGSCRIADLDYRSSIIYVS